MKTIRNYKQIGQTLHTSGQPSKAQLKKLSQHNVDTVINLALADSDLAIVDEGNILAAQGINYVHIPVDFEYPKRSQFFLFQSILNQLGDKTVLAHCVLNMRVSAFVYIYRVLAGESRSTALKDLTEIWEPEGIWANFINELIR